MGQRRLGGGMNTTMAPMREQSDQHMEQWGRRNVILDDLLLLKKDGGNHHNGTGNRGERANDDLRRHDSDNRDKQFDEPSTSIVTRTAWTQITNTAWTTQTATAWTTQTAINQPSVMTVVVVATPTPTSISFAPSSVSQDESFMWVALLTTFRYPSHMLQLQPQQQQRSLHHLVYQAQNSQGGKVCVHFPMELHVKAVRLPYLLSQPMRPLVQVLHLPLKQINLRLLEYRLNFVEILTMTMMAI